MVVNRPMDVADFIGACAEVYQGYFAGVMIQPIEDNTVSIASIEFRVYGNGNGSNVGVGIEILFFAGFPMILSNIKRKSS